MGETFPSPIAPSYARSVAKHVGNDGQFLDVAALRFPVHREIQWAPSRHRTGSPSSPRSASRKPSIPPSLSLPRSIEKKGNTQSKMLGVFAEPAPFLLPAAHGGVHVALLDGASTRTASPQVQRDPRCHGGGQSRPLRRGNHFVIRQSLKNCVEGPAKTQVA